MKLLLETLVFCALLSWFYHWGHCNGRIEILDQFRDSIIKPSAPIKVIRPEPKTTKVYRV